MQGKDSLGRHPAAAVAVILAVFVVLYPLDVAGYCDDGGCPEITQISASASPDLPATGVLTTGAAPAAALGLLTLLSLVQLRPDEILLSPEPPPPRS